MTPRACWTRSLSSILGFLEGDASEPWTVALGLLVCLCLWAWLALTPVHSGQVNQKLCGASFEFTCL